MNWRKPQLKLWRLEKAIKHAAATFEPPGASHGAKILAALAACTAAAPALAAQHSAAVNEAARLAANLSTPSDLARLAEIVSTVHLALEQAAIKAGAVLLRFDANGLPKEKPPAFVESVVSLLGVG
jgi:hypothetical protein